MLTSRLKEQNEANAENEIIEAKLKSKEKKSQFEEDERYQASLLPTKERKPKFR